MKEVFAEVLKQALPYIVLLAIAIGIYMVWA